MNAPLNNHTRAVAGLVLAVLCLELPEQRLEVLEGVPETQEAIAAEGF